MASNLLLSFDSSDAGTEAASRFLGVSTSSALPGGVTLGSLAESFHSEDYDDVSELPNGRGDGRREEQEASALEEQQEKVRGEREREREDVRVLLQRQISRNDLKLQQQSTNSRPASTTTSRPPVQAQARPQPTYPSPVPPPTSASPQSNTNNSINEESLLRELSMESKENSRSREILASSVNYERGGRGGAKAADRDRRKTGGDRENGGAGSMTLREQEKVIVQSFCHCQI